MILLLIIFSISPVRSLAVEENHTEKKDNQFNLVDFALHHIGDSYSWDFFKKKDGSMVSLPLPRILWNKQEKKLYFFASTQKAIDAGFIEEHHLNHNALHGKLLIPGSEEKYLEILEKIEKEENKKQQKILSKELSLFKPFDISFTKNVLYLFIASFLLLWIFVSDGKRKTNDLFLDGEPPILQIR